MDAYYKVAWVLVGVLLVIGCRKEIDLEFRMNNSDYKNFTSLLTQADYERVQDSVLTLKPGDSLHVRVPDHAIAARGVKSREWIVNGKNYQSNLNGFNTTIKRPGFHSIRLCVNGKEENCITKYVYVMEDKVEVELPPSPIISITTPSRNPERVDNKRMKLLGAVSEIEGIDQLTIVLNDDVNQRIEKFDAETGVFEVHVQPLERGKNTIVITAMNAGDTITEELVINYLSGGSGSSGSSGSNGKSSGSGLSSGKSSGSDSNSGKSSGSTGGDVKGSDSPTLQAPWITVIEPADGARVKTETVSVKVHMSRITDKDDIVLKVNDQRVSEFNFASDHLTATVRLNEGANRIFVEGSNQGGKKSKTWTVTKDKSAPAAELPNNARAGLNASTKASDCNTFSPAAFSISIRPSQDVELQSFIVFAEGCGGLKLTLSGGGQSQTVTKALVKGQSKISLSDVEFRMKAGTNYTLSGTSISNFGGCSGQSAPKLLSAGGCEGITRQSGSSRLNLDQGSAEVVFDINYRY